MAERITWKLAELCSKLECDYKILGDEGAEIGGLELNSKEVKSGFAFFCIVGQVTDGHKFAKSAVDNGASCLFVEHEISEIDATQVVVPDTRDAMAQVASIFYGQPTNKINVVGITGTNGKTTITNIVSHVLTSANEHCGLVGTNGIKIDEQEIKDDAFKFVGRTTPEAYQLQKMMYEFENRKINNVVMEVSSHALDQDRAKGINFSVTAFTNLTQDHLDYHKDMNDYFEAKAKLFSTEFPAKRVVCIDDEWGQKLAETCKANGDDVLAVGLNDKADLNLNNTKVDFPLIGKFNKQNMLVAYGICKSLGLEDEKIVKALETMPSVEGRMQVVSEKPKVIVDYSHTPDALEKAILTCKETCKGRLITLFGCGGDRDKDKRPKMGKIASENSDVVVVTSDNPRSEDPQAIIDDIMNGINDSSEVYCEADRGVAIKKAIELAAEDDYVLLAGKGHEKYQVIGDKEIRFDDREEALKHLG